MAIRWGIIGCGNVSEVKSGPGFQKAAGSALVMVMRRDAAKAEDYARRHGVPRWTTDAEALLRAPEVDAVYIATPPGNHLEYALRVAAAGKPAYVEKPMARNHAECQRMIDAFAKAGQPLFVAFYRRRLPRFLKAKELVASGRLGRITTLSYRYADARLRDIDPAKLEWRLVAEHSGGGIFLDLACHALDIFDFILGPIESIQGMAANLASPYDVEDVVALHCRFAAGALGACSWNFAGAGSDDVIDIAGTLGKLTLSVFGNEPVRLETGAGVEQFDLPNPLHIQQPLIESIVDELHGRGRCPST
ncbi:MAG: Gfo/Idh/MocA family oxidoreductase, partial [Thermoguttaceae bacterium]